MNRLKAALKAIARAILWPISRFFDPRFAGMADAIHANVQATTEATELLGRSLDELQARIDAQDRALEAIHAEAAKASGTYFERVARAEVSQLEPEVAGVLNRETSAESFAAEKGLYFNSPIWIGYEAGEVFVRGINERIAEVPFVFRVLASLPAGASVLDVGATESTVALSLASLGYKVTALDPRPYPLEHPNLTTVVASIEDWSHDGTFDAVVCLSTIEHVGIGAYGEQPKADRADLAGMRRMRELTAPGGLLVLTTRFGRAGEDEFQRTYDQAGLDELLAGWEVKELTVLRRGDEKTWVTDGAANADDGAEKVALVAATRS
jgi:2-polyprenyl-3-methyl-5-hydroxy-6-metoxy-1,4-benzoquinol methylase